MSVGIGKYKALETFRLVWLKHRGNTLAACEELGWPLEVGRQYEGKIKKRVDRDVAFGVSQSIMMQLLLGYESRVRHLYEMLERLKDAETQVVSTCCSYPVEPFQIRRKVRFRCSLCGKECTIRSVGLPQIIDIQYRTLRMLQDEDGAIVDFAKKMGFVNPDAPPPSLIRNQVLVLNSRDKVDKGTKSIEQEETFVKQAERLPPMERERIRKSLETYIKEGESDGPT